MNNLIFTPVTHTYVCTQSVVSPAPSSVNNVTVISYKVDNLQNEITLNLSWSLPLTFNGQQQPYNICIGDEPLEPNEDVQPNAGHLCGNLDVS